jgi:hypothetical protein
MAETPPAKRKQAERQRMRKAGYVLRHVWVKDKDWPRVKAYLRRFRKPL